MKTRQILKEKKTPTIRIDKSLDKYDNIILFPEKLAKAEEDIKRLGFPRIPEKK